MTYQRGAPSRRRIAPVVAVFAAALVLGACGGPFPQSTLDPSSDFAVRLADLFMGIFWWAVAVFVIVEGALLYTIFRFRARRGDEGPETPRHVHGHTALELAWTLAPALVLVFIAVPTMTTIWDVDRVTTDPDALVVQVIGHQWWWEFRYPEYDLVTANELHLPAGRTIDVRITSADVIHSFWFPRIAGKRDALPGRETHLWFTADSIGRYIGQCAEFCGLSHALMKMEVVVQSDADFEQWVAAQTQPSPGVVSVDPATRDSLAVSDSVSVPDSVAADLEGFTVFQRKGCIACHRIDGTTAAGVLGPDLSHIGSRGTIAAGILDNTPENMIRWLRDPASVKPGVLMPNLQLNEEELRTLADYLAGLE